MKQLETDYLVIGAGALGITFVDVMLEETDANFIIVDRFHMPGGHWNNAYPFVRLHQPSSFYGVASTDLGSDRIDEIGSNKGYFELASGPEILTYFEKVMRERFLPSGRVQYFPMCSYEGNHTFSSLLSKDKFKVTVNKKLVDSTFFKTTVPSMHKRNFNVEGGVNCIPPNNLPRLAAGYNNFVVLGGGKTAMDTCIWLLDNGADPDTITWVRPRESWLINRRTTQPGRAFFETTAGGFADTLEAMRDATSVEDLFVRLEASGSMLRIDPTTEPTMFHYATVSEGELEQLRRIKNVVRGQRIKQLRPTKMIMTEGEPVAVVSDTLFVDCTAKASASMGDGIVKPIFEDEQITLQAVNAPLVTYSAAVIAYVEANFETNKEKNDLCVPVKLADTPAQWLPSTMGNMWNAFNWSQNAEMNAWIESCRLNPNYAALKEGVGDQPEHLEILGRIQQNSMPAMMNAQKLAAGLQEAELQHA